MLLWWPGWAQNYFKHCSLKMTTQDWIQMWTQNWSPRWNLPQHQHHLLIDICHIERKLEKRTVPLLQTSPHYWLHSRRSTIFLQSHANTMYALRIVTLIFSKLTLADIIQASSIKDSDNYHFAQKQNLHPSMQGFNDDVARFIFYIVD